LGIFDIFFGRPWFLSFWMMFFIVFKSFISNFEILSFNKVFEVHVRTRAFGFSARINQSVDEDQKIVQVFLNIFIIRQSCQNKTIVLKIVCMIFGLRIVRCNPHVLLLALGRKANPRNQDQRSLHRNNRYADTVRNSSNRNKIYLSLSKCTLSKNLVC
jgi:hypothetical protein